MDSPNSLCSLSHTTTPITTHTSHGIHIATTDKNEYYMVAGTDGGELVNVVDKYGGQANSNNTAATDDSLDGEDVPTINQSPMEINKGDDESVRALNDLHRRWTVKYEEGYRNSQELLFRHLVHLTAEQAADHLPCLAPVSVAPLAARDEAAMVPQPITPSPDRIHNIGEPEMMMMEVPIALNRPLMIENQKPSLQVSVENASRLGAVCRSEIAWMLSPIPAADTAATAHMASATGRVETAKTAAAAVSAIKTAVVTLPKLPIADAVSVDAAPVHVTDNATSQLPTSSPIGIFIINDYVKFIWPLLTEFTAMTKRFFFFRFKIIVAMEEVIEGGPWLFQGQPIMLLKWEPGMIKLRHSKVELWTNDGLNMVESGIGRPLYPYAITRRTCTRLDFARICVMLDINAKLPKHLVIMSPTEESREIACKVDVKYEWLPPKRTTCMSVEHATKDCPSMKVPKSPVNVYVQKARMQPPIVESGKAVEENKNNSCGDINQQPIVSETPSTPVAHGVNEGMNKGKN
ncbi:UNVERIFIED_CONTAM: hypothetical protein Sindi_0422800 [Sesamum indicum]